MLLSPASTSASLHSDTEQEDDADPMLVLAAGTHSHLRRRPAVVVHTDGALDAPDIDPAPEPSALWCGAARDVPPEEEDWWDAHRPAAVPFLPLPFDSPVPAPVPVRAPRRKSSGCGARVHIAAHPARTRCYWVGWSEGVEGTVVPLGAEYFAGTARELRFEWRRCGCTVEGVGCAVCGNALGARHAPCPAHTIAVHVPVPRKGAPHYVFLADAVSPPIRVPAAEVEPDPGPAPLSPTSTRTSTHQLDVETQPGGHPNPPPTDEPPPASALRERSRVRNSARRAIQAAHGHVHAHAMLANEAQDAHEHGPSLDDDDGMALAEDVDGDGDAGAGDVEDPNHEHDGDATRAQRAHVASVLAARRRAWRRDIEPPANIPMLLDDEPPPRARMFDR
ncbi:hypothetical protein FB451DRAFT_1563820 [Mycena latifolia]|nr:hypothetical protein FB451DRAFT_1563820 [Mycena latifolia]